MAALSVFWDNTASEVRTFRTIVFSRGNLLAKSALVLGIAYHFSTWEIIPDKVQGWGYVDDIVIFGIGVVAARALALDGNRPALADAWGRAEVLALRLAVQGWFWRTGRGLAHAAGRIGAQLDGARSAPDLGQATFKLLGYRLWWTLRSMVTGPRQELQNLIVIGGAPRSGTTLLRVMLGRHPMIAAGPETTVFLHRISSPADIAGRTGLPASEIEMWQRQSSSQAGFIARLATGVLARTGKTLWAEKTPHNVMRFGFVRRRFPNARMIHIIRDGRDVVCSLRREPFSKIEGKAWDSSAAALRCAAQWRHAVQAGMRFRGEPAYYELRYEDLVSAPEATARSLFAFLGLPWSEAVLRPSDLPAGSDRYEAKAAGSVVEASVARWQADLNAADRSALRVLIGPLVEELGYGGAGW